MAELVTVARPYAKAAFKFAKEKNAAAEWSAMLGFAAELAGDSQMAKVLDNPQLTSAQQADTFIQVSGDKLNDAGKNLVKQLAENKRLATLPQIVVLFEQLLAEEQRKQEVDVTSAFELSKAEEASLKQLLEKKLSKEISLQSRVDKSLIGGVVIHAGDMVIDGSVRGKIEQLSQELK